MTTPRKSFFVLGAVLLLAGGLLVVWHRKKAVAPPAIVASPKPPVAAPAAPTAAPSEPEKKLEPLPPLAAAEVAATRRMYGAHAPLRAPAVANPDSEQNRQILQTMVIKALSRAQEAPPSSNK